MTESKTVLALFAHPDDAEFMCVGTLALLARKGWKVHIATMTPGDVGSTELSRQEISTIRRGEAAQAAAVLGGMYHCLEQDDVFILYDRPTLLAAIELFRRVRPRLVFTHSPSDYMVDHEMASKIAQTACLAAGIPNIETPGAESYEPIPYLYYADPVEGKDKLGREVESDILVDISTVIETKEKMLSCHESQRSWLLKHHGVDEYIRMMKDFARKKGKQMGTEFAEGFRQHLGFSYPQDDILKIELGEAVWRKDGTSTT